MICRKPSRGYICHFFNVCVDKSTFPSVLKHANITPVFKKGYRVPKKTTDQ